MRKPFFLALGFLLAALNAGAEQFVFKQNSGDKFRILSLVNEDVYVNRRFSHSARILNRCSVEIGEVREDKALYSAVFQTAEQLVESGTVKNGLGFQWSAEYDSVFRQDKFGRMTIDENYYMPVVRDVPVFPDRNLKEGEGWTAEGHEVHDFRKAFGIEKPYRIPFRANYVFLGGRTWKGKTCPAFSVSYRIFYSPPPVRGTVWPKRITVASDQIVYWDTEMGRALAYTETFRHVFELSDGTTIEFRGNAEAEIIESEVMKKEELLEEIAGEIKKLGINDATVRADEGGVTISLENVQFQAESAVLMESEKRKLDKIGEILLRYSDRDILVGGHTALSGSPEGRMKLSMERAGAVSDYLVSKKVRDPSRIVVRGFGAEKPLAGNNTEEGMRKNRRVEITILEN